MMPKNFATDFPLLNQTMNGRPIVADNGATTQKPSMIQAMCGYYGGCNATLTGGAYALSIKATDIYETAQEKGAPCIPRAENRKRSSSQERHRGTELSRLQLRPDDAPPG